MYVLTLDGEFVARGADGSEPHDRLYLYSDRVLKAALLLDLPVEMGEPTLLDSAYLFDQIHSDDFCDALRHGRVRFNVRPEFGRVWTGVRRQLEDPGFLSAVFRGEQDRAQALAIVTAPQPSSAPKTVSGRMVKLVEGVRRVDALVEELRNGNPSRNVVGVSPSAVHTLSQRLLATARWIESNDLEPYCEEPMRKAAEDIRAAHETLLARPQTGHTRPVDMRSAWLPIFPMGDQTDDPLGAGYVARAAIHHAYTMRIAAIIGSDRVWGPDAFVGDGHGRTRGMAEYSDALNARRPLEEDPVLDLREECGPRGATTALDAVSWRTVAEIARENRLGRDRNTAAGQRSPTLDERIEWLKGRTRMDVVSKKAGRLGTTISVLAGTAAAVPTMPTGVADVVSLVGALGLGTYVGARVMRPIAGWVVNATIGNALEGRIARVLRDAAPAA